MSVAEFQFNTSGLLDVMQKGIRSRLYDRCVFVTTGDQILDRVDFERFHAPQLVGNDWKFPFSFVAYFVQPSSVIDAGGVLAAPSQVVPGLTAYLLATVRDDRYLTVRYGGIDTSTLSVLVGMGLVVATFEQDVYAELGAQGPMVDIDLFSLLPERIAFDGAIKRSVINVDDARLTIRIWAGDVASTAPTGPAGTKDYLQGKDVALFVGSDAILKQIDTALVAGQNPSFMPASSWSEVSGIATVDSVVSAALEIRGTILVVVPVVEIETVHVKAHVQTVFSFATDFGRPLLRTTVSFDVTSDQSMWSKAIQNIANQVSSDLEQQLTKPTKDGGAGFAKVGPSYVSDEQLPTLPLTDGVTVEMVDVQGTADGLVVLGTYKGAAQRTSPRSSLSSVENFSLNAIRVCSERGPQLATEDRVTANASFLFESRAGDYDSQLGGIIPISSATGNVLASTSWEYTQCFTRLGAQQSGLGLLLAMPEGKLSLSLVLSSLSLGYLNARYPCEFLLVTSGGTLFVNLGAVPAPVYSTEKDGVVTNVKTTFINDCRGDSIPRHVSLLLWDPNPPPEDYRRSILEQVERAIFHRDRRQEVTEITSPHGVSIGVVSSNQLRRASDLALQDFRIAHPTRGD